MSRWLAFDTSTDVLSLAVAQGEQTWAQTWVPRPGSMPLPLPQVPNLNQNLKPLHQPPV